MPLQSADFCSARPFEWFSTGTDDTTAFCTSPELESGVLRVCFLTAAAVVINPDDDMLDRWFEAPGCAAMSQYWRMVRSFVIIFVSTTASFQHKIEHSGYVLGYFALWRR